MTDGLLKPEPGAADMPLLRIDAVTKKFGGFRGVRPQYADGEKCRRDAQGANPVG